MKKRLLVTSFTLGLLVLVIYLGSSFSTSVRPAPGEIIREAPFEIWTTYEGRIDARHVETVLSLFNGTATIVELAPEGSQVSRGDLLVRFDSSDVERDILRLERDAAVARAELESLVKAKLPLELRELELNELEAHADYEAEQKYLEDSAVLAEEGLVSPQEMEKQRVTVERLHTQLEKILLQMKLTREYLHPAEQERAEANLAAADQELNLVRNQLDNCTVTAPTDGTVVYRPLHVGGEFRTVRVGDTLYKNQAFMAIPDMSDLRVECFIPESEIARAEAGDEVQVTPLAYPDVVLRASVESVGSMAQTQPGRPAWQQYFRVLIRLHEKHPALRPGMSAHARICFYRTPHTKLIPRSAVSWEDGQPLCYVRKGRQTLRTALQLGPANSTHYEVRAGLEAGDRVVIP